jgi:RNA polymerase sigma-70 factor, ECF subfamily
MDPMKMVKNSEKQLETFSAPKSVAAPGIVAVDAELQACDASLSDEALLNRFVELGDRQCFETLMRRYQYEVYNYLRRYLGDDDLAEDAFQLTFIRVFQKGCQFDASRRFRPWLYGIATNQAIDLKRSAGRKPLYSLDVPLTQTPGREISNSHNLPDHRQDDGDTLEQAELSEQLRLALDQVGEPGKSALNLIYLEGMAYKDAAKALNVPVGTVKSRVHSAVRKLAEIWQRTIGKGQDLG